VYIISADENFCSKMGDDVHVVFREESLSSIYFALQPVLVDAARESDNITFVESQFTFIFWFKVIEGSGTWSLES
jgi:hypothetical protein